MDFGDYKDYPILVVDDEDDFLALFRRLGHAFHLETESFPSEALIKAQRFSYCVVISDNKMRDNPEMPEDEQAGVTFLRRIREIDTHPLRVLVTGWSKEGMHPNPSRDADINILIDKLDVLTDEEWSDTLRALIDVHRRTH